MEGFAWAIRKAITWGTWLVIYFLFVPAAKRRGLSRVKWFFLGVAAMWGTFLVSALSGIAVNLLLPRSDTPDGFITGEAIERQLWIMGASFLLGWTVLLWTARKLRQRPIPIVEIIESEGVEEEPKDDHSHQGAEDEKEPPLGRV